MSGGGNIISWSISHYCSPPAKWEIIAAVGGAYLGCDHQHTVSPWSLATAARTWALTWAWDRETLPSEGWLASMPHFSNCDIDLLLTIFSFSLKKALLELLKNFLGHYYHWWKNWGILIKSNCASVKVLWKARRDHVCLNIDAHHCQKWGPLLNTG